jgi:hypothetical protein
MARIRSIKPEFFTSETVASLGVHARLTFIGLWTHADDAGRALDNPRLIKAAVWPLDDEVGFKDIAGHLDAFEGAGLICRYEDDGKQYLHITHWDEHQRPKNPSEPRFPACSRTSHGGLPPEGSRATPDLPQGFSASRARAEQGAGSREQGYAFGAREEREAPKPPLAVVPARPAPTAQTFVAEFVTKLRDRGSPAAKSDKGQAAKQYDALIRDGFTPEQIRAGTDDWLNRDQHVATLTSFVTARARGGRPRAAPNKAQRQLDAIQQTYDQMSQMHPGGDSDDLGRMESDRGQAERELPRPAS